LSSIGLISLLAGPNGVVPCAFNSQDERLDPSIEHPSIYLFNVQIEPFKVEVLKTLAGKLVH